MRTLAAILAGHGLRRWLLGLGGPGLILVGLVDNSVIPIPGGMDLFVILLSAHHHTWWIYYGAMATAGAVIGGYLTYRLAKKGGKGTLAKRIGTERAERVYRRFEKHGFSTVVAGSILPPPFPLVPILMAAGTLQYPRKPFLAALTLGRGIRFFALAFLGQVYGTAILRWLRHYHQPLVYAFIVLATAGVLGAVVYFKWYRPRKQREVRASA